MATKIVTKNSSTASAVPTASDLVQGELAVNVADKRLFTEDNGGSIIELGTNPSTIDINAGSIDGTAIGASSASTGAFTTLTATGAFTSRGIDDNADATAITIDSSENVGVGTSSPAAKLDISGVFQFFDDTTPELRIVDSDDNNYALIGYTDGTMSLSSNHGNEAGGADVMQFLTGGSERMRIDSSGNVGISTSDPKSSLEVKGTFGAPATSGSAAGFISRFSQTSGVGSLDFGFGDPYSWIQSRASNNYATNFDLALQPNGGNVLVGNTDSTPYDRTSGNAIALGDGLISSAQSGGNAAIFNRMTNDGSIVQFRKDGTTVGSVNSSDGDLAIGTGTCGIRFNDGVNAVIPFNITTNAQVDNSLDLGFGTLRWDDIYATNGTIQTSDRNEKQDIAELSDAEQRVAVACKGLLRKFRWKDSVAEKGDEARTHFGIIAQDLQSAFAAEGLDAGEYAMFISTTWTDEETNEEKTRMGVRYSELLAFIIAAI